MNDIKPANAAPLPAYYVESKEDEISLIDLWLILAERKKIILLVAAFFLILAVIFGVTRTEKETYTTTIRIGSITTGEGVKSVESTATTLAKLNEAYIPLVKSYLDTTIKINARTPQGSDLIVLESTTPQKLSDESISLHKGISDKIIEDHYTLVLPEISALEKNLTKLNLKLNDIKSPKYVENLRKDILLEIENKKRAIKDANTPEFLQIPIKEIDQQITKASSVLESLKKEETLTREKQEQSDKEVELIKKEVADLSSMIAETTKSVLPATREANDEAKAMTLLLLENTVQQHRAQLATLQRTLHIELPLKRSELEKQLEENLRNQAAQDKEIELLRAKKNKISSDQESSKNRLEAELRPLEIQFNRVDAEYLLKVKELEMEISDIKARLKRIQKTTALSEPLLTETKKTSSVIIISLGLILGVMMGVFVAFFMAFLEKVKSAQEEKSV